MKRDLFITFEGIEGSGKTTQVHILKNKLQKAGFTVVQTREPGGTPLGEKIRQLLLDPSNTDIKPLTELLLYMASRAQHYKELIVPALERGEIVISDRFLDASVAYQGAGRQIKIEWIKTLNDICLEGNKPDVTFILDLDIEESRKRLLGRDLFPDRLESEGNTFFHLVREYYLDLATSGEKRFKLINASKNMDLVSEEIWDIIKGYINV
ncbi:MAG: dTMP kinase [Candidatus Coatesbacteria bacterium]|nr:dTMP kinase [Candidatus Coatesbacteria bacterium]